MVYKQAWSIKNYRYVWDVSARRCRFLLGGMVMGLTCSPFLDTRGNPRSGSPDRAAATSQRRYLLGGAVLGMRGVFCGCWRCLPRRQRGSRWCVSTTQDGSPERYVRHHQHFLADFFLGFGRILPSARRSSWRMSKGMLVQATSEPWSCFGGVWAGRDAVLRLGVPSPWRRLGKASFGCCRSVL
jgi:hypothetical protein